jgi:hypothetical protein
MTRSGRSRASERYVRSHWRKSGMNLVNENDKAQDLDYKSDILNHENNLKYLIPISCLDKTSDVGIHTEVRMCLFSWAVFQTFATYPFSARRKEGRIADLWNEITCNLLIQKNCSQQYATSDFTVEDIYIRQGRQQILPKHCYIPNKR